ncbi:hypothetical protein KI387_009477, partial [Taxus chinensis]
MVVSDENCSQDVLTLLTIAEHDSSYHLKYLLMKIEVGCAIGFTPLNNAAAKTDFCYNLYLNNASNFDVLKFAKHPLKIASFQNRVQKHAQKLSRLGMKGNSKNSEGGHKLAAANYRQNWRQR